MIVIYPFGTVEMSPVYVPITFLQSLVIFQPEKVQKTQSLPALSFALDGQ